MSVLIFLDQAEGHIKKSSFEAAAYGAKVAEQLGVTAEGIVLGNVADDLAALGKYGLKKVHTVKNELLDHLDAAVFANVLAQAIAATGASVVIFSNNMNGKAVAPRLSAKIKAGLVSGAIALPDTSNGFVVKKSVFSGKAFANIAVNTAVKIIALNPNSYNIVTIDGNAEVVEFAATVDAPKVTVSAVNKIVGEVPLSEAELVISGGRGLKGPENWGLVTDLAKLLGAATACSRAVADVHWRHITSMWAKPV